MLIELRIENFAIIQYLTIDFQAGLTTFTGETGAGKSILLDALAFVAGGRADSSFIRSGAERALVEATFRLPEKIRPEVTAVLAGEDLLDDENHYLTMGRELRREGRAVARINGRSASVALLREIGSYLLDIHGQSEHLSLLNVRQHLNLLDRYAGNERQLDAYHSVYRKLTALRKTLKGLRMSEQELAHRTDLLNFQAQEIESANLRPGEEEALRQERDRLANAESLASLAQQSFALLDEGSNETPAIRDLVGSLVESLSALSRIDTSQAELFGQVTELADTLARIGRDLQDYREGIEFNPRRLEQVEERLGLIVNLKRKYGGSIESALAFAANARRQLETIATASERIAELEVEQEQLLRELAALGYALSETRKVAAEKLGRAVEKELDDLSMNGARFSVDLDYRASVEGVTLPEGQRVAFDESGLDRVEFLIAPNPGEGLKPLVKIASGGETSRLMLALKNVLVRADHVPTLIFDEIDQGIGGRVGAVVGEKLWQLARQHQVLCVTHLPQLAAFGDQHYRVRKLVQSGRTITQVDSLSGAIRLDELAQMLGTASAANLSAAKDTLERAQKRAALLAERS
ncbi:MAG TPA: DNA repair protein RecN [Levilinea sp.]|nr:DNA repair protein RecN [Levilinea sp.]